MFRERAANSDQVSKMAYTCLAEVPADDISKAINSHPAQGIPHAYEVIAYNNIAMNGRILSVDG